MKTTQYFQFRRQLPDRAEITDKMMELVLKSPLKTETQEDGRMKVWGRVDEAGGKILRVVLLEDGTTVHNAFFDRNFKE
jgi:hypothetical protein